MRVVIRYYLLFMKNVVRMHSYAKRAHNKGTLFKRMTIFFTEHNIGML